MQTEKLLTGAIGTGAVEIANNINLDDLTEGTSILIQVIIGIVTLIKLFKKQKS